MKSPPAPSLAALADRVGQLYSPPAVAIEVLRLTEQPQIDARALCACLEADAALSAKLLRVVNSALYGLPHSVASLSQAIALIGVQPLKLLVLGFSTPVKMSAEVGDDALRRYWTDTLTTAAAARLFAETGWGRMGDEALAAGLMQGVGQSVLLAQLRDEYAPLLTGLRRGFAGADRLETVEREALGFEHRELSVEMMRRWRLPSVLVDAVERQFDPDSLATFEGDEACVAQALGLANLANRLVNYRELGVLRELTEGAQQLAAISQRQLNDLIAALQERTRQLAHATEAPVKIEVDYREVLVEAHARLSLACEKSAIRALNQPRAAAEIDEDERLGMELLAETRRLAAAARVFLAGGVGSRTDEPVAAPDAPTPTPQRSPHHLTHLAAAGRKRLANKTDQLIAQCRDSQSSLTLSIVSLRTERGADFMEVRVLRQWIGSSDWAAEFAPATWASLTEDRAALWLPGVDRIDANRLWSALSARLDRELSVRLDVGVAGVSHPPRNFDGMQLLVAAERCLGGALAAAGPTVKSIEVF